LADFSRAVVGRFVREDNFAVEVHIVAVQSKHFSGPQASHPCNRDAQSFSRMSGRAGEMQEGRDPGQWTTAARPVGGAGAVPVPVLKAIPVTAVTLFCSFAKNGRTPLEAFSKAAPAALLSKNGNAFGSGYQVTPEVPPGTKAA